MRWLKNNAALLAIMAAFAFGAYVNGWYRDSQDYSEAKEALSAIRGEVERQGKIGAEWQQELKALSGKRVEIIREVQKIVDRPVYGAECIDADGVRLANESKNGHRSGATGGMREPARSDGNNGKDNP